MIKPTDRPYQFHKDPLLEDIVSVWPRGKKSVGRVFTVDLLASQMKDSFSRAACNYVEENCNLRQYNELLPKSMLVAFCENKGEKTIETSLRI